MLHNLSNKKRDYFYNQYLNKKRKVLFETIKGGKLVGYTDNYVKVKIDPIPELVNSIKKTSLIKNLGDSLFGKI